MRALHREALPAHAPSTHSVFGNRPAITRRHREARNGGLPSERRIDGALIHPSR